MKSRKWLAVLLGAAVVLAMLGGSIGKWYENVGVINGTDISSGLYLMAQYSAYTEAKYQMEDPEGDVLKQEVEGQKANDWMKGRTEELLRRFVCVRALARERGIVMDSTGEQNLQQMMQYWTYLAEMYAQNGIAQSTVTRFYTVDELSRQLFQQLYAEGGELAVPDSELKTEYGEKYAHLRMLSIPVSALDETVDVREEVLARVDGLVEVLEGGKTLEEVAAEDIEPLYQLMGRSSYNAETPEDNIFDSYIAYTQEDNETYSEEFLHYLQGLQVGAYGAYNMGSTVILYQVIPTFTDEEEFESTRATVLEQLKKEEYEDYLKSIYSQYPVSWVFGARWYFRPGKIVA